MDTILSQFLEKILTRTSLTGEEQDAVLALRGKAQKLKPHETFALLDEDLSSTSLVIEGICARVALPTPSRRQITAFYLPGDMPNLYGVFSSQSTGSLEAITSATIIRVPHALMHRLMRAYPAIAEAFTRYIAADASITDQWVANLGGRQAKVRLSHLYCELAVRSRSIEGNNFSFRMPIRQAQAGEACGVSTVHVNRAFMALRNSEILRVDKVMAHVLDWRALQVAGHFDEGYLVSKRQGRLCP